ncbi:PREDICTED: uncharacterized protein LOC101314998 isoform X2 [Fragaria vesca subsp. vesca]|uniref:uncharacterized protein LOC101314998 isoform X2 n=1 Tax=Fragaria vesca subsp. vesca TaxID=101020 RepID=UPI0002C2F5FC|nr:PREDICTED: uncharacterized protein LOC101314998 isoform X2 [Fragaria vesca subsp. vesca]
MAICSAPLTTSFSGSGSQLKAREIWLSGKSESSLKLTPQSQRRRNSLQLRNNRSFCVRAEYSDGNRGGGADFLAGFLVGGAVFGTLAYVFAPQIRRSLLNEDEYGFRKARRPIYYDEGLEKTRQTLNAKISQLNSAIDNVSSRLRGGNNAPAAPVQSDPEVEATM